MKIIALDYGTKRTGIAETDELQIIASPLTTVETKHLKSFLEQFLSRNSVGTIVIGEPLTENGKYNEIELEIRKFIEYLKKKYPHIHIEREDERYTSKMAEKALAESGAKKKKRQKKEITDMLSATLILQDYLKRNS